MTNLIAFALAGYGATMIIVYGKIFESLRTLIHGLNKPMLSYMLKCTMCMGLWVGMVMSFLMEVPFNFFVAGCVSSGATYFLSKLVDDDGFLVKLRKE